MSEPNRPVRIRCSFCGKDSREARRMIAGPDGVHICDACVQLCREIVSDDPVEEDAATSRLDEMRPSAIRSYLDTHVIGQDRAKRVLSVAVYNHFKRLRDDAGSQDEIELSKGNILLIGPTGSGKTLMARTLARRLGVPFTITDATTLTEAGYVGEDVESIVKNLWLAAGKDAELAGRGIVCLDEVDKISRGGGAGNQMRDVGGEGVQQALLKVIESQMVSIPPEGSRNRPQQEFIQVDTRNVLFVCAGAFEGLHEIVERRLSSSAIGFGASAHRERMSRSELLRHVRAEDLIRFGLIPEFVGRLPVIVSFDELSEGELVEVLWKPRNALVRQYRRLFELENVKLRFHHEALEAIVAEALGRGSGARGLRAILEDVMLDVMYEVPGLGGVDECVITEECVRKVAKPILHHRDQAAS
ncbi:MAG: ATP-dependent Clp protease ATP-binding subunit ClpX [Deltaproteobacteria bacterium]|nr:MAG: ATP-dependent Clp protease ATP-binding subunit ClpX [Deltaproteobacteria bacterium]